MSYILDIKKYKPLCKQEELDKEIVLNLYEKYGDTLLSRECEEAHFSSSAIVIDESKEHVLFAFHNIYKSWSWLGGHVDLNQDFYEVAKKEVYEESGVKELIPYQKDIISIEILPVKEHLKNGKLAKNHLHLNVSYVFIASKNEKIRIKEDENSDIQWIKIQDIDEFVTEDMMKPIYQKIINRINLSD